MRRLDEVTTETAAEYAAKLKRGGITASTYNRHIVFLRSFFRLLVPGADPFAGMPLERVRQQSRRAVTMPEFRRLLEVCEGDLRTLVLLGASTGLRLGDCCTLRWSEVDADSLCVMRRTRKTAAEVAVPIPRAALDALGARGDGPVLPRLAQLYLSGTPGRDRINRELREAFRRAGIEMHGEKDPNLRRSPVLASFHSLRHTWVSAMSAGGAPPAVVSMVAGHASRAMTEHYTHVGAEALRATSEAVGRMLAPGDRERDDIVAQVRDLALRAGLDALKKAKEILLDATQETQKHLDDD